MSESKLQMDWLMTSSIVRATLVAFSGKEPPIACYVPARFRPLFYRPKAEEFSPEARRKIVNDFIDVLHGVKRA